MKDNRGPSSTRGKPEADKEAKRALFVITTDRKCVSFPITSRIRAKQRLASPADRSLSSEIVFVYSVTPCVLFWDCL